MKRQTRPALLAIALILALGLSGCAGLAQPMAQPSAPTATPAPVPLKIALLPFIDALPVHVAEQEGLFAKAGLQVELIPVSAAPQRDQLIAAGQADGMVNEILSSFFFNKQQVQVQVVRYDLVPTAKSPHFFIMASAKSGITRPEQLKGVPIGVSQSTIIEYVTERVLQAQGFAPDDIKTIAVPNMSDRMTLLASGELKAAVLPDPLAALAIQQGAVSVLDDAAYPHWGFSVITFRKAVIDQHPEAIRAFLAAIEQAVQMVNASPAKYTSLLSDKKIVPAPLLKTYQAPPFPLAGVPTEAEWQDALAWAKAKGLLTADVPYATTVNASFLPKP